MAELPIMPLKTDALIADTTHMTAEEFGVYVRLLIAMWRHGGKLVNNAHELANIGGVHIKKWKGMADRVLRPMTIAGGYVSQKRLTSTWLDIHEIRQKRIHAANFRWAKERGAPVMHMHSKRNANQNQTSTNLTSSEYEATREAASDKGKKGWKL